MKVNIPYYIVALAVSFLYGLLQNWFPDLPLTQEQVLWVVVTILTLLSIDVTNTLKARGLLG